MGLLCILPKSVSFASAVEHDGAGYPLRPARFLWELSGPPVFLISEQVDRFGQVSNTGVLGINTGWQRYSTFQEIDSSG
jgi:hypothetical protein